MIQKICVLTGGRADYGLLKLLMRKIRENRQFQLQVIATGYHFLSKFGSTYREILKDGFKINARVDIRPVGDSAVALGQAMGLGVQGISRALAKLRPDLLVLLGDRYEILAAASAATLASVPIAHLHGGELTEGAYDDAFRHAITKMSHLHFVSTRVYRKRVIQMGECHTKVFQVGALGVDNVLSQEFLSRKDLEKHLKFKFQKKNILITFHPTTLESGEAAKQTDALLNALRTFPDLGMIFTMPGADKEGKVIWKKIQSFVKKSPNAKTFSALGSHIYLSVMKEMNAVVGNSSSGLLEAPVLRKPTVNIGNRQKGRLQAGNVVSCPCQTKEIQQAIRKALSPAFLRRIGKAPNPFADGGAADRIVRILQMTKLRNLALQKTFYDLPRAPFQ